MRAVLDSDAIRVAHAAADSSAVRPVLQCIRIGDGKIVACDGFILAERPIETEPESGEAMLLTASALLAAQQILPKRDLVVESLSKHTAVIKAARLAELEITVPLLPHEFPDYKQVIPKTERLAYVSVNPTYLRSLVKLLDKNNGYYVQFKVRAPTAPVEIVTGKTKIFLMPMNVEEDQ